MTGSLRPCDPARGRTGCANSSAGRLTRRPARLTGNRHEPGATPHCSRSSKRRGKGHTPRYGLRVCADRKSKLRQGCSRIAALLQALWKLPRDALRGCYSATGTVSPGLMAGTSASGPTDVEPAAVRIVGGRSELTRRPWLETARIEEPDQHPRRSDSCRYPAGSCQSRRIVQQAGGQACQQQRRTCRCQPAHDRPVPPLEADAPGLRRPRLQLLLRRPAHPQSPSDKASSVPRNCLRLAAPASAPASYSTRVSA